MSRQLNIGFTYIILLGLFTTGIFSVNAQNEGSAMMLDYAREGRGQREFNKWSIQLNLGFSQFHGNLSDQGFFGKLGGESPFGYSLIVARKFSPLFSLRGQLLNTNLQSTGPDEFNRYSSDTSNFTKLRFDADLFEYNLNAKFDLSYAFWGSKTNRKLSWYGTAGIGFANWRTTLYHNETGVVLAGNEINGSTLGSRTSEIVFPLGMGLNYMLNKRWKLHLEQSFHIVNSDVVDAYEGGSLNDIFTFTSFGISYSFSGQSTARRGIPSDRAPMLLDYPEVEGFYRPGEPLREDTVPKMETKPERYLIPEYEGSDVISGGGEKAVELALQDDRMEEITITRQAPKRDVNIEVKEDVVYHVQILATRKRVSSQALAKKFNIRKEIIEYYNGTLYRYVAGSFERYTVANTYAKILHEKGVYDAFVVAYRDGKRVGVHLVR